MTPAPEFIAFLGDEIMGLVNDEKALEAQWRHWDGTEMRRFRDPNIPIYNTTGNHTVFNALSERVYQETHAHLPQNGPAEQKALSYFVRRGDLLMIFVNTMWRGLGGEGHVETEWLAEVLNSNADARWKFVAGHHPVFPVNGYSGPYQRTIGDEYAAPFRDLLVRHDVTAYLCSHILAFDVQVHRGVLQITTGGAGTAHLSPREFEYHHFVQACVDGNGLRYQVVDEAGVVRERLNWPPDVPSSAGWPDRQFSIPAGQAGPDRFIVWRLRGDLAAGYSGEPQKLLAAPSKTGAYTSLWIGLVGRSRRLTVSLQPQADRSPHYWHGPTFESGPDFDVQVALHFGMGPGGILWRDGDRSPWNSMDGASAWGAERLKDCDFAKLCLGSSEILEAPFRGRNLDVSWFAFP